MVVESEGYLALIEHLAFNLEVFTQQSGNAMNDTIEDTVTDLVASNIMTICAQNPNLDQETRFKVLQEADSVVEDLSEVLAGVWSNKVTTGQMAFLEEYIALMKNLFDSAVQTS
ncbi:DUF3802 family protein [Vibrio maerlii]|uniref:DUF3802 family protein n=1 Tax=Vibrio maerlii TaxID=2231648 RepID=UPI000E3E1F34|nr:DUF3802 family protein [Vibrio maerlii]